MGLDVEESIMSMNHAYSSDVAFTPTVKALQTRKGSRASYGRVEEKGGWQTRITPDLADSIAAGRPASCESSTTRPLDSPTLPATGNTSLRATSRTIRRRTCS